jgi:hypothetical protein
LNSGGVDGEGKYDGEDGDGEIIWGERMWRTRQAATEIRSGDMRARRRARSDTPHPLDSRASLFHSLHNTRSGSIGNWPSSTQRTISVEIVR